MGMPRGVYERQGTPVPSTNRAATEKVGGPMHRTRPSDDKDGDRVGMNYIAMKPMKVNGAKVKPGDLVPTAATWRNLHNYISTGHLAPIALPPDGGGGGRV